MLIDWFTVVAQLVNFLILVALLKHFLYAPLLRAIDSREERIAARLAEADRKDQEAVRKADQVQKQLSEVENRGGRMIEQARKDADQQRNDLVQAARQSVQAMEAKWREDLRREEMSVFRELRKTAAAEIVSITRHALVDLASADIERSAIQAFLEKLQAVDAGVLRKLCLGGELTVVSATELSQELRRQIEQVIENRTGSLGPLRFERSLEMSWGLELRGSGQRIGWTPDSYIDSLEEKLRAVVEEHAEAEHPLAVG